MGTPRILELCRQWGAKLIYSASSSKFGNGGKDENLSPYSWAKSKMVELIKNYGEWYNLDYEITYFFNVYGPGQIMTGDYATKQYIHEQYYPLTAKKLANHINTFLAELAALEKKVDYGGKVAADDHPRLPLVLRHNEFVKNIFLTVRHKQGLDLNGFG